MLKGKNEWFNQRARQKDIISPHPNPPNYPLPPPTKHCPQCTQWGKMKDKLAVPPYGTRTRTLADNLTEGTPMCRSPSTRAALKARCDGFPTAMYNTSTLHPSQLNSSWRSWRSSSMKKTSGLCFVMLLPCHPGRSVLGIWIELGWCTTKKSACATWCHGRKFSNSAAKKCAVQPNPREPPASMQEHHTALLAFLAF